MVMAGELLNYNEESRVADRIICLDLNKYVELKICFKLG